ncbi:MAG: carbamoyltransferase HypF [Gemmatimonadetes bacterium]|uniref:Carbamoyltransferase n=1 Tax=Candidatus Kutchimonas denitrificans TaxID=3056748 RepID=A0AAE4Z715_9BACT|nr:carbamoyltransferase HypF [Gemmatimonadota bacterium]NIR74753.1 carbamoyltransferase HypF [Candidatus Kutchimonas denitrificans]NIS01503.1 carbamoyltransferase HypF [Gemmatimonadota bacterium]NIT67244.1 carbamoyltransferase HypF [Gemmatimonadota bacterium]NIU52418.1 carbamoyltransferase HypF [Gemmatimonadota bacterium]
MRGLRIRVRGIVQGVGFRPFVYGLAERHGLTGWVRNTSAQVEIELDGEPGALDAFLQELRDDAPPLARIDAVEVEERPPSGFGSFEIVESAHEEGWQAIPPDTATCEACHAETLDPNERRYRYPFTNCTHCGPRFTIIEDLPYDRRRTTMRRFEMCADCRAEYEDPRDRRFHAQPVACPACGPHAWLHGPTDDGTGGDPLARCAALLRDGRIVALKGLGGYQLACDATNDDAVSTLRSRKRRYGKPFALMVPDEGWAERLCRPTDAERNALLSRERPIVLMKRRDAAEIAPEVAPGLDTLGLMLPYTPLHHLLLREFEGPLVMTSGNLSEEPIAIGNDEAVERLGEIADAFLLHNRDIYARYDDSVVRQLAGVVTPIRRARGFAPAPVELPFETARDVLAVGAQQKNTFCLVKGSKALLGQHIGDLENLETLEHFQDALATYERLFRVRPEIIAHDMHPDYLSTQVAQEYPDPGAVRVAVQHHHAHVVSVMAEHGIRDPVIGVAYDGTGYGTDGTVWGGEVLVADWSRFERVAHLRYAPMLGGEAAIRKPYRMAAGYIWGVCRGATESEFAAFTATLPIGERIILRRQFEAELNTPLTSSCGRLFDVAAALLDVRREAVYEGQAAVELEAVADPRVDEIYPYDILRRGEGWIIDPAATLRALWCEHRAGRPLSTTAAAFHNTVASFTAAVCERIRERHDLERVALSGGCFQNALLTARLVETLEATGFEVLTHRAVPPNDGGLSLGQAVAAYAIATSS